MLRFSSCPRKLVKHCFWSQWFSMVVHTGITRTYTPNQCFLGPAWNTPKSLPKGKAGLWKSFLGDSKLWPRLRTHGLAKHKFSDAFCSWEAVRDPMTVSRDKVSSTAVGGGRVKEGWERLSWKEAVTAVAKSGPCASLMERQEQVSPPGRRLICVITATVGDVTSLQPGFVSGKEGPSKVLVFFFNL